jgi:aminomethyltransferase
MSSAVEAAATRSPETLHHTPFHQYHVDHGAKLVPFAGWEMPLLYTSIIEEHRQVRFSGGLFDVSHMGRLRFSGRDACRFLDLVCTRQIVDMAPPSAGGGGQVRYSLICNERGGCRDDVLVYRIGDAEFLMVCNAANREKLLAHFAAVRGEMVFKLSDETFDTAMVALQGPRVIELIRRFSSEVASLRKYRFTEKNLILASLLISRTGYTGEDGVEVILPAKLAGRVVGLMLGALSEADAALIRPAGLGARDSLRLEAGMPLYGHEITEDLDPLSAGLNFAVKLDKTDADGSPIRFIGQEALQRLAREGLKRRLVGLRLQGQRSARQEMKVLCGGRAVGFVTSGCLSPTLGCPIAMAYVPAESAATGTALRIDLGRTIAEAEVVALPFYKAG